MSPRYERVAAHDEDESPHSPAGPYSEAPIPSSPPPSFRSHTSSPTSHRLISEHDPLTSDADRTLADTFDSPSDDEGDDGDNGRRRLGQDGEGERSNSDEVGPRHRPQRSNTILPTFVPPPAMPGSTRVYGGGSNDGVFANLSAKPSRGEEVDEKPPTYEQAAADATPPYWETTILAPGSMYAPDSVFVDGLPVGSLFSFVWNAMISMSFQLVGFLLTYLLHTTHAAKNGSRAGLGITLVQYGFSMKGASSSGGSGGNNGGDYDGPPPDPTSHDFDPNAVAPTDSPNGAGDGGGLTTSDWLAYILMIVGWFILIRAVSDFLRARRHEQLVLQSPERDLGVVPVVAEGERPETTV